MAKQETEQTKPKAKPRNSNELIHCENCGEYYAATYRSCPFCEERPTRGRGGTRATNKRGGGYGAPMSPGRIAGYVISLVIILAAVAIVFSMLRSLVGAEKPDSPPPPSGSQPVESVPPTESLPPETEPPVVSNATGITLNYSDFTMSKTNETVKITAKVTPADYTGTIVWTSSDPSKVYVGQDGTVYAIAPGTVDVTATIGNVSASCIVRNKATGTLPEGADVAGNQTPATTAPTTPATSSPEPGTTAATPVTLNRSDFTMRPQDPATFQMTADGGDGQNYTWSSSDTNVATVSATGLVTRVNKGMCTITVTSGGQTATCTVRVN